MKKLAGTLKMREKESARKW